MEAHNKNLGCPQVHSWISTIAFLDIYITIMDIHKYSDEDAQFKLPISTTQLELWISMIRIVDIHKNFMKISSLNHGNPQTHSWISTLRLMDIHTCIWGNPQILF